MKRMLCTNKVKDYDLWKPIFDENSAAAQQAGLELENLWRDMEDSNQVFFILKVHDVDAARKFISDPAAAEAGQRSGVIDGECWFVE